MVGLAAALVGAVVAAALAVGAEATDVIGGALGPAVLDEPVGGASGPAQATRVSRSQILSRLTDVMDFMAVLQRVKGTWLCRVLLCDVLGIETIVLGVRLPIVTAGVTKRWRS